MADDADVVQQRGCGEAAVIGAELYCNMLTDRMLFVGVDGNRFPLVGSSHVQVKKRETMLV